MSPIAARMALQVIECLADIVGIEVLLAAQALDLRRQGHGGKHATLAPRIETLRALVRQVVPFWQDDGLMHPALAATGALVRGGALSGAPSPW